MMYVNREPRFYVDITFSNSKWFDGTEGDYIVDFTYSGSCGKEQGSNDYTSTGYLVRKGMDSAPLIFISSAVRSPIKTL